MAEMENAAGAFRSNRLVYRGLMFPEDEGFLLEQRADPATMAMGHPGYLRPANRKTVEDFKNATGNGLLTVMICLPRDPEDAAKQPDTGAKPGSVDAFVARRRSEYIDIGTLGLSAAPAFGSHHRNTQIGLNIIPAYQGKGYGPEAIEWAMKWAFQRAGLHKFLIASYTFNMRACKLYEKMGFTIEGRAREQLWYDGAWYDRIDFAMLEHEWREREKKRETEGLV